MTHQSTFQRMTSKAAQNHDRSSFCTYSNNDDLLSGFIIRHPFSSRSLLENVFGEGVLRVLLEKEAGQFRDVDIPDLGPCYALKDEPNASILGVHRREVARRFALTHIGSDAVRSGLSPGLEADGEFCWQDGEGIQWWRIWVDIGGCAPEALPFIVRAPKAFGEQVRDVVLTSDLHRLDLLAAQIEHNWNSKQDVHLWVSDSEAQRTARPRVGKKSRKWTRHSDEDIEKHIRQRMHGSTHQSRLAGIAKHLSSEDWSMLVSVGNNPLFTTFELAYLHDDALRAVRKELDRLQQLGALGLIKTADDVGPRCIHEGRKILTWRGIELLAEYWGTSIDVMQRFHPWPQKKDDKGKGHVEYATRWASKTGTHQHLTREFALALLGGSRRVSNGRGEVRIRIDTTIASRIAVKIEPSAGETSISWVVPDASAQVEFWRCGWVDGERMPPRLLDRHTLLIEVDRGTVPFTRLTHRLDRYAAIWRSLERQKPALVWVIDGSPFREKQILDMMREQNIHGWTATIDRLVLPQEDTWWLIHPPVTPSRPDCMVELRWNTVGGMAPWRRVWMSTDETGYQPFLGREPWKGSVLSNAKRRAGQSGSSDG